MSSEKTEQPTDHKLRKAREEGQVAKSKDFTQTLLMGALLGYTLLAADSIIKHLVEIMAAPAAVYGMSFRGAASILVSQAWEATLWLVLPYVLIVVIVGIFAEVVQTGVLFAFKALIPKGDKLNPATNLKQMFSMKNLVEFVKSIVKVVFLTLLVAIVLRDSLDPLVKIPAAGLGAVGLAVADMMTTLVIYTFLAYSAIALFDFAYQRYSHIKGLMMSMEEIKQEYKQMEGDPHVKGHRRQLAQEIAMGEQVENTRKASVVVTNPTHLAVAIYYEQDETPLPIVVAKGEGLIAERMKAVAEEEGIPVMQDVPLARALMRSAQVNQYIPSELIEPVAEVLRALKRLADEQQRGET